MSDDLETITDQLSVRVVLLMQRASIGADLLWRASGIGPNKIADMRAGKDVKLSTQQIKLIADLTGSTDREVMFEVPILPFPPERQRYLKERAEQIAAQRKEARLGESAKISRTGYIPAGNIPEFNIADDSPKAWGGVKLLGEVDHEGMSGLILGRVHRSCALDAPALPAADGQPKCCRVRDAVQHGPKSAGGRADKNKGRLHGNAGA